jgi:ribosomal small subunit protein bTHX
MALSVCTTKRYNFTILSILDIYRDLQETGMGKGDKKTARGKIWRGSYGTSRPHHPGKAKPKITLGVVKKKKK